MSPSAANRIHIQVDGSEQYTPIQSCEITGIFSDKLERIKFDF